MCSCWYTLGFWHLRSLLIRLVCIARRGRGETTQQNSSTVVKKTRGEGLSVPLWQLH
jgi:hypothetical protein